MKGKRFGLLLFVILPALKPISGKAEVKYIGDQFRDPFKSYLPEKEVRGKDKASQEISKLKVSGIIWGTQMPLAIINQKVYKVGDSILDAKILEIGKKGVLLEYRGETYLLRPK